MQNNAKQTNECLSIEGYVSKQEMSSEYYGI